MSDLLLKTLQSKVEKLEMLAELSKYVNSTLTTSEIQKKVIESTTKVLGAETATLYLVDQKTNELIYDTVLGPAAATLNRMRMPIDDSSLAGSSALHRKCEIINNVQKDKRHKKTVEKKIKFVCRNMILAPVIFREKLLGVLQVINKKEGNFEQPDLEILNRVTNSVAIALENAGLYETLKDQFVQTIEAMAYAIEKRDVYTGGHTKRVTFFSTSIASCMNVKPEELTDLRLSAVLHDIGKIGVEDRILNKPSPLTNDEFQLMKQHPEIGYEILKNIHAMGRLLDGIRFHHERFDGKGYPLGLKGEEIPLFARIIAAGDTFDAMVSHRPYRRGLKPSLAYDEIVRNSGGQFDPRVVEAFKIAYERFNFPNFVAEVIGEPDKVLGKKAA